MVSMARVGWQVDGVAASSAFTLRVDCGGLGLCSTAGSRLKSFGTNLGSGLTIL